MKHSDYIEALKTATSKTSFFVSEIKRQAIETIPESFKILIEPLVNILNENKEKLLASYSSSAQLFIGDMQPAVWCMEKDDKRHFCCTLLYQIQNRDELFEHSIVIDFTSNEVMNDKKYEEKLLTLLNEPITLEEEAITYGELPTEKLIEAWKLCQEQKFNENYLSYVGSPTGNKRLLQSKVGSFCDKSSRNFASFFSREISQEYTSMNKDEKSLRF